MCADQFEPTGDIIEDICRRFRQLSTDVQAAATASQVESEARRAYSQEMVYISSGALRRKRIAIEQIVPGESTTVQARRLGISRVTVWRQLKRKKSEKVT